MSSTREQIEKRLAKLRQDRANVAQMVAMHDGAIQALEQLLAEATAPEAPKPEGMPVEDVKPAGATQAVNGAGEAA